MSAAFTTGPWEARDDGVVVIAEPNQLGYQQPIKLISPWRESAWDGDEEAEANARLIAAAPSLYSALAEATELLEASGYSTVEMRAALAKARGESAQ